MTTRARILIAVPFAVFAVACASGGDKTTTTKPVQAGATTEAAPSPTPAKYTPVPTDFEIKIKITEKQCFGTAGCNITFRIEPGYGGPTLSESDEWLVTYTVSGGTDGPLINSFTLRGREIQYDGDEIIQVASAKTVVTAKVTEVAPN